MATAAQYRLIVALNYPRLASACSMARRLAGVAGMFKIGSQLFVSEGPRAVRKIAKLRRGIFLDLKFHDIPSTVRDTVAAAVSLPGLRLINLHALGGVEMMRAARGAMRRGPRAPKLLAVTVLTSLDVPALRRMGLYGSVEECAVRLALLAQEADMDGVVAPAQAVAAIRTACGNDFVIVVPGIRPAASKTDDQSQVGTPRQAIGAGADYLVVGRPITSSPNPRAAAESIVKEISAALKTRATARTAGPASTLSASV